MHFFDRVKETTTTTGIGTIALAGASSGYVSFGSVYEDGHQVMYAVVAQSGSEYEVGIGTIGGSGTTLTRDSIHSSTAGGKTPTNFSSGTKDVFVTVSAVHVKETMTKGRLLQIDCFP